jgi:hypothetical protein
MRLPVAEDIDDMTLRFGLSGFFILPGFIFFVFRRLYYSSLIFRFPETNKMNQHNKAYLYLSALVIASAPVNTDFEKSHSR